MRKVLITIGVILALLAATSIQSFAEEGEICVCVSKWGGRMRLSDQCRPWETRLCWNVTPEPPITELDLVGTWECFICTNNMLSYDYGNYPFWLAGPDNLYNYHVTAVTFVDDGDGTYSWSSEGPNPFRSNDESPAYGEYLVFNNVMFATTSYEGAPSSSRKTIFLKRLS